MSKLYVDTNLIEDEEKRKQEKESFEAEINDIIENKYKSDDSEVVYALFNPQQVALLQEYYKGFSVEFYKELNGTVELQIQEKNQKVREKINKISEYMGPIDLKDWVYDGMVDSGKNNGVKCDLCPRPIRYAHFAVNKKTKECLRFGCSCAADFFNLDKSSLASMKTIQSKTLRDIKIIASIMESKKFREYYDYMCGHIGEVVLKDGRQGLLDLMTFMVKWKKDDNGEYVLVGNAEKDEYPVLFGDNSKGVKTLEWIKENIVSCLNADLGGSGYDSIINRKVIRISVKDADKTQLNTVGYIKYALKFLDVGLPIPLTLAKKLNSIIQKITHQHHPDYIKYAQELLIEHNFENSTLLTKAFTDFIINYLASSLKVEPRDEELKYWGVRGPKTFYYTVLTWETVMVKLLSLKDLKSLVSKGLVSEEELPRYYGDLIGSSVKFETMMNYIDKCLGMFVNKKPVTKTMSNLSDGFSKYGIKGSDVKIGLEKTDNLTYDPAFTVSQIPLNVGLFFKIMQSGYRKLIQDSILNVYLFLKKSKYLDNDEDTLRYLCLLEKGQFGLTHKGFNREDYYSRITDAKSFKTYLDSFDIDENVYNELLKKYKNQMAQLRSDLQKLYTDIFEIHKFLVNDTSLSSKKKISTEEDYEDIVIKKEKNYKDYFIDYCNLLISKRGNKKIQNMIHAKNLNSLLVFKQLNGYSDMFLDIQNIFESKIKEKEERALFNKFFLDNLKYEIKILNDVKDIDDFIKLMMVLYDRSTYSPSYLCTPESRNLHYDIHYNRDKFDIVNSSEALTKAVKSLTLEICKSNDYIDIFNGMYNGIKELYANLNDGINFKEYFNLLNVDSKNMKKDIKNIVTVDEYGRVLKEAGCNPYFNGNLIQIKQLFKNLSIYKSLSNYSDITFIEDINKKVNELETLELEKTRGKIDDINKLKDFLSEHLNFYAINVDALRNTKPIYKNKSDVYIRQKEAFSKVHFEKAHEINPRFIRELEGVPNLSDGTSEMIEKGKNAIDTDYGTNKLVAEALRVELYNKKLIYNHFDITNKLLQNLNNVDLTLFDLEDLKTINSIIGNYYLLKSDIHKIKDILIKYNVLNFDFNSEELNLPEPNQRSVREVIDLNSDNADSTGFTGVQKAELVKNSADFGTLPQFIQNIINTVVRYKRCTPKQLQYVNQGYETLINKSNESSQVDNKINPNVSTNSVANNNSDVSNDNLSEDEKEMIELAKQILGHSDFKTLQSWHRNIINTVVKRNSCSAKQKAFVLKAKDELGID